MWEHTHVFAATEGGTVIDDHVRYRLPASPLGDVAYPLVERQLARIFAYRQQAVSRLCSGRRRGSTLPHPRRDSRVHAS